ncbi:MAG TPA: NapC/NirT family cytochrome c [Candidatus Hydrogenedentes bacterium]|nr:NapC/NirT family cytochrome c [Candidatus Hydrogenedentota bacterium]HRT19967.1 NapC/NirT family cytochrome c [Candidatus Hydrogenedentota bacterium]HRT64645.1 NapC/NirT family cytochrome c [Candidatus Hydrogenedentota bacterium]
MPEPRKIWLAVLMSLYGRNWITLLGGAMAWASAMLILGLLGLLVVDSSHAPYIGILTFMVLPGAFIGGLLLIPVGVLWDRFRAKKQMEVDAGQGPFPVLNLNDVHTRRVAIAVIVLTGFNLLILATVTYHGVVFMDSPTFCGAVCHTVMEPEYVSYKDSPHSRVHCVDCHIGPGAPWFVKSKLSGLGQVIAVTLDSYERPIPTPVTNLRPSRDTCEQCHWPERFAGDRIKVLTQFGEDEANTPTKTVLLMHIGGGHGGGKGIHSWHINPEKRTIYTPADPQRKEIARVRVENAKGEVIEEFHAPEGKYDAATLAKTEERVMDCMDCHSRPTHIFRMPARAMDEALEAGRIDPALPFIKKAGLEALSGAKGATGDEEQIARKIREFYEKEKPEILKEQNQKVEAAIAELQSIYRRNVFPDMKVTWGTYTSNLGHEESPGCFRCHNDEMTTKDGKAIGQDCTICHNVLAWDETDPEILKSLELQ